MTVLSRSWVTADPSAPYGLSPCRISGKYSFAAIVSGMFQVGLMVMDFISAVMIGVGVSGLPSTIFVADTCRPF